MNCFFCDEKHPSRENCLQRHKAMVTRIMSISPPRSTPQVPRALIQPTLPEFFKQRSKKRTIPATTSVVEQVILNHQPIVILDSSDDNGESLPDLTLIDQEIHNNKSFSPTSSAPNSTPASPIRFDFGAATIADPDTTDTKNTWSCIQKTVNDPVYKSRERTALNLKYFIEQRLGNKNLLNTPLEDLFAWLVQWSEPRGKCRYKDNSMGISPKSVNIYFNMFINVLCKYFNFDLLTIHPIAIRFPSNWQQDITREKGYVRKQAGYFSREDVIAYVKMLQDVSTEGSACEQYYAKMGMVILPVAILFAGCRLGELLHATAQQVQFVTVRGKMAIAIHSVGSKSDLANQRSSPIIFGTIDSNLSICPVTRFIQWLRFRQIDYKNGLLQTTAGRKLFPLFSNNTKVIKTNSFTKEIRKLEKKYLRIQPRFKAHVGRFTITTLALFGKDSTGKRLIEPELLEHQMHWVRNTATLSNYLGHNASFVKGSFYHQMDKLRNEDVDTNIDEKSITDFNLHHFDTSLFDQWHSDNTLLK